MRPGLRGRMHEIGKLCGQIHTMIPVRYHARIAWQRPPYGVLQPPVPAGACEPTLGYPCWPEVGDTCFLVKTADLTCTSSVMIVIALSLSKGPRCSDS